MTREHLGPILILTFGEWTVIPMTSGLDIRFDIEKVEAATNSSLYGLESWKVFWRSVDPGRLPVALLRDGDTAATLSRRENVFCIEVEASPDALAQVRSSLTTSEAFRQVAATPPFEDVAGVSPVLANAGRMVNGQMSVEGWAAAGFTAAGLTPPTSPQVAGYGQPPAYPQPAYPQPGYAQPGYTQLAYPQPAPAGWYRPPAQALDPRLSPVMAEYAKRRFRILVGPSGPGGTVTMERRSTPFNWFWAIGLFFLAGVGTLVYVAAWAIWGVHRTYRVGLGVGPYGEVQEFGDVRAVYDRDRLSDHRKRLLGFGGTFATMSGIWAIATVGVSLDHNTTDRVSVAIFNAVLTLILGGIAFLQLRAAREAGQTLNVS